jgi:glycine/D-amino acid oxidase-like deaminating enzyme
MLSAAQRRHGENRCGAKVVDLLMTGDRVSGGGWPMAPNRAEMVVNCAGRWTNEAVREAGLHLPLAPTVGFLVFTSPVAAANRWSHHRDRRAAGRRGAFDAALESDRRC